MKENICFESYPFWIVLLSNIVSLVIYAAGAFLIYQVGWVWLILYLLYIAWLELRLLRRSCVNCYYYGKVCAFGKGKLCSLLFKKGDASRFNRDQITWKEIIPDFLVSLIPIIVGIVLLVINFNWLVLLIMLVLLIFTSIGNGLIRGSLSCKHCRQREIGCPAERLFNREKTSA